MIWNPGDDTDLNEGGAGTDTVEVNGGNGAEQFTTTANGTRVRFDRLNPAPFSIDIGTSENLVLNANGGDDSFSRDRQPGRADQASPSTAARATTRCSAATASTSCSAATATTSSTASRATTSPSSAPATTRSSGIRATAATSSRVRTAPTRWLFNGSNANESMDASANGGRVRFTRDVANIVMDLNDVESIVAKALGGADTLTVNDLSGTDVTNVVADLAAAGGGDDGAADNVIVNATNGDDVVTVAGAGRTRRSRGLAARRLGRPAPIAGSDRLTVNALAGDDVVDASGAGRRPRRCSPRTAATATTS